MEMTQMETEQTLTRTELFDCSGPAELDLRVGSGRIEVRTADVPHVRVELAVEAGDGTRGQQGFPGLLGRSSAEYEPADAHAHAVRQTQITFSEKRRRLVVRTSHSFRRIRLVVLVEAPDGSRLTAAMDRGSIAASGLLSALKAGTHTGDVAADRVDGDVDVRAGSGDVRLGRVTGRLHCRAGSGEIESGRSTARTRGSRPGEVTCGSAPYARTCRPVPARATWSLPMPRRTARPRHRLGRPERGGPARGDRGDRHGLGLRAGSE
jgi:hypothetical protein